MHVAVNITDSQVADLVAGATDSLHLNWVETFQDLLNGVTEVRQRSSDADLMTLFRLSNIERVKLFYLAINKFFCAHSAVVREFEDAMLSAADDCLAQLLILLSEWIVDNAETAAIVDGKTNKDSDSGEVALDEVIGAVKWVNPDDGIARIERLEVLQLHVILVVELAKRVLDPLAASLLALVELGGGDALLDGLGEDRRLDDGIDISNGLFRLLTHDLQGGVKRVEADFNRLLHFQVGNRHWVLDALCDGLQIVGLVDLADDVAALLAQEDAHGQELGNVDVLVRDLELWRRATTSRPCISAGADISHFTKTNY